MTTFFLFLVVALKTQARTTKLTTPTIQISQVFKKFDSCSAWGVHAVPGGALTTFPCKFGPIFFLRPRGCTCTAPSAPLATPMSCLQQWSNEMKRHKCMYDDAPYPSHKAICCLVICQITLGSNQCCCVRIWIGRHFDSWQILTEWVLPTDCQQSRSSSHVAHSSK